MKKIILLLFHLLLSVIEDIFIFLGLSIIVYVSLRINYYLGLYILGFILVILGLIFSKFTSKRSKKEVK